MTEITYPTRCQIVDVDGLDHKVGPYTARTPTKSHAHIGKQGTAERVSGDVRITLDDGAIIMGFECWWVPINEA